MKMMMQDKDMQKCMDKIAADSTMRIQMMDQCKGDKVAMIKMCKQMMDNPEMHKMMMKGGMMKHKMMDDSTKTMDRSEHESHQ